MRVLSWRPLAWLAVGVWLLAVGLAAYAGDAGEEGRPGLLADHLVALLASMAPLLVAVSFIVGGWWSIGLPFLVVGAAAWIDADCDGLLCGTATAGAFGFALIAGIPLVATGVLARRVVERRFGGVRR